MRARLGAIPRTSSAQFSAPSPVGCLRQIMRRAAAGLPDPTASVPNAAALKLVPSPSLCQYNHQPRVRPRRRHPSQKLPRGPQRSRISSSTPPPQLQTYWTNQEQAHAQARSSATIGRPAIYKTSTVIIPPPHLLPTTQKTNIQKNCGHEIISSDTKKERSPHPPHLLPSSPRTGRRSKKIRSRLFLRGGGLFPPRNNANNVHHATILTCRRAPTRTVLPQQEQPLLTNSPEDITAPSAWS